MQVRVVLFGHLTRLLPTGTVGNATVVDVETAATVDRVLDVVGVPDAQRTYLMVNGKRAAHDAHMRDGDELRVIVPLGGG